MNRKFFTSFYGALIGVCAFLLFSCSHDETERVPEETVQWKELRDFTRSDLEELLENRNLPDLTGIIAGNTSGTLVKAIKISCKSSHPDGSDASIDLSGVLLLPGGTNASGRYQEIIAPPFTYTLDADAPSNQYALNEVLRSLKDDLVYWSFIAASGYVVLLPDYPGFGDSLGECFIPYIEAKPMVRSTIDLTDAANRVAKEKGYDCRTDLTLCGYSQGAYVAASVARALETNASYGYTVDLLMIGGAPCNLKRIADLAMGSETFSPSYFLPYAIWGYKKNGHQDLKVADLLKEPYASSSDRYFDGKTEIEGLFPVKVADLYTTPFINRDLSNTTVAYVDAILTENSLQPWVNKCDFRMIHGMEDNSVYYQNAKEYAEAHTAAGGTVEFISVSGDHSGAGPSYYAQTLIQLVLHKANGDIAN